MMGSKAVAYVSWREVLISNERGRREVHYYLRRSDGGSDLAVVGKERSLRHMLYTVPNRSLSPFSHLKWRSRREVLDWLSSLVSDSPAHGTSSMVECLDDEDPFLTDEAGFKDQAPEKLKYQSVDFSWVGSSWTCRKRRKHYQSFCRNGIRISVHDFVHVMAEDNKRLVAYLEDLYEDSRSNNMVLVRWFHKIDEVGVALPPKCNDREIFFSLCLQDLSVECIDGLVTVLNSQHYEKYLKEVVHRQVVSEPYMCCRQFDNDDIKPFDITQVQGYWKQELLRYMHSPSRSGGVKFSTPGGPSLMDVNVVPGRSKPWRRLVCKGRESNSSQNGLVKVATTVSGGSNGTAAGSGSERLVSSCDGTATPITFLPRLVLKQKPQQHFFSGCSVEVLSQDSGIRGCWFRCVILKKHGDKLKVRYQDVLDADETGNLEEWVLASKIAKPDDLGVRMSGRSTVRPLPPTKGRGSMIFDVGVAVDAWWQDGWWEGIVIRKDPDDKFCIFFPGERRTSVFSCGDLRRSLEWESSRWNHLKERPDIANSILLDQGFQSIAVAALPQGDSGKDSREESAAPGRPHIVSGACSMLMVDRPTQREVPNLAQDDSLAQLRWKSSRKRRRSRESSIRWGADGKTLCDGNSSSSQEEDGLSGCDRFLIPKPLKIDHDNCKFEGSPLFVAPIPSLTSLVMSQ